MAVKPIAHAIAFRRCIRSDHSNDQDHQGYQQCRFPARPSASRGALSSIFLTGLKGEQGLITAHAVPLSNELNGISVFIDFDAPLRSSLSHFSTATQQINVQVPRGSTRINPLNPRSTVEVRQNGVVAQFQATQATCADKRVLCGRQRLRHRSTCFRLFASDATEPGASRRIPDCIRNQPWVHQEPATDRRTSTVRSTCGRSTTPPSSADLDWSVPIGTATATPSFMGLTPGTVGVSQVNFQLPQSAPVGDQPLSFVWTTGGGGGGFFQCRYGQSISRPAKLTVRAAELAR